MTGIIVLKSLGIESSGKEELFDDKEKEKSIKDIIVWKTYPYVQKKRKPNCLSCCFNRSNSSFEIPLTDISTWEKNIKVIYGYISGEKALDNNTRLSEINLVALKRLGLKTTTFLDRISQTYNVNEATFEDFFDCFDVEEFSQKYVNLTHRKKKIFDKVIGKDGLIIIKELKEKIETLSKIVELIKKIEGREIQIKREDNLCDKIKKIDEEKIRNSFRYFKAEEMFGKKGFIFLNSKSLKLPNLSKITNSDELEEHAFFRWLTEKIKTEITDENDLLDLIMPCLSFNLFADADSTLRYSCPSIFQLLNDVPKLNLNSKNPTRFFINKIYEKSNHRYEIAQEKSYSFRVCPSDEIESYDIGQITVCWHIAFNDKTEIISDKLIIKNIIFFNNAPLQMQIDTLTKFL